MPFQSEKQRRYLWANEPEIARDWTDTYGSGIAKALGGRIGYNRGQVVNPGGYAGELSGSELFLKLYKEGKIDNLQQAMEDADRYDAGETTNYEKNTGNNPLDMYQKYSDPSEVSLGSGLAEDAKQTIKSKKDELRQKMIESGVLDDLDLDQSYLSNEDYLADADARQLMASSGMFGTDATYVDKITPQTRGPREMFEMAARPREGLASIGPHGWDYGNQWQKPPAKQNWLANLKQYAMPAYNFARGNIGAGLLGIMNPLGALAMFAGGKNLKDSRFYRGATTGAGGYTPEQLNSMNALGGYYSEPARQQRRTQSRIQNMLARKAAGKSYSQKNLDALTGNQVPVDTVPKGPTKTYTPPVRHHTGGADNRNDPSSHRGGAPTHRTRDLMAYGGLANLWQR